MCVRSCAVIYRPSQGIKIKAEAGVVVYVRKIIVKRQAQDPIDCQSSTLFFLYVHYLACWFSVLFTEKTSSACEEE